MTRAWIVLLVLAPLAARAQTDDHAARAKEAAAFADSLAKRGDDYRAIGEYERALFLDPSSPEHGRWQLAIAEAYRAGEQYEKAGAAFDELAAENGPEKLDALLGSAKSWLSAERFETATQRAEAAAELASKSGATEKFRTAKYLAGWAYVRAGRDAEAKQAFDAARGEGPVGEGATKLAQVMPQLSHLPSKSPALAGVLGLVPGLGHLYLGDPVTAMSALVWNGVFAWAIVDAVRAKSWSLTVVLSMFEAMWYGGSIVGSISGAHRFNRDARVNAMEDLARIAPPSLVDEPVAK